VGKAIKLEDFTILMALGLDIFGEGADASWFAGVAGDAPRIETRLVARE
jgi:hypothetical protein